MTKVTIFKIHVRGKRTRKSGSLTFFNSTLERLLKESFWWFCHFLLSPRLPKIPTEKKSNRKFLHVKPDMLSLHDVFTESQGYHDLHSQHFSSSFISMENSSPIYSFGDETITITPLSYAIVTIVSPLHQCNDRSFVCVHVLQKGKRFSITRNSSIDLHDFCLSNLW